MVKAVRVDALIAVMMVAGAAGMWGVYFDTAWHRTVGRDSFLSLPHLFIYGGGFLVWAMCMLAIGLATTGRLADAGGVILRRGPVRAPLGFALCAFGTLVIVLAVPTDLTWHAAFGKDLLIWSPPHLQGVVGGAIGALGMLFAIAGQKGRGVFARPGLWYVAMLLPLVDLLHYVHWSLAHYTIFPWTRTPDFYPFLVAVTVPIVMVAAARGVGPWAPTWAGVVFFAAVAAIDAGLAAAGFARPAVTPVFAVPAVAVSLLYTLAPAHRARLALGVAGGVAFIIAFVAMERAWMTWVIGTPWPAGRVVAGLPVALVSAAVMGAVGWVVGGFVRAAFTPGGAAEIFGGAGRARWAARAAVMLVALGLASTYQPQDYGPPLRAEELALRPDTTFPVQEALFWDAVIHDDWRKAPTVELYTEGAIDGIPLPVGPAWCADDASRLAAELPHVQFGFAVNGVAVDLGGFPTVRRRLRDGRECAWVGVVSGGQRASRNTFIYTIAPRMGAPAGLRPIRVDATVVFKDP